MVGLRRLGSDTAVYGLAMVIDRALGFLLLPILTGALSKDAYGAWSQVLTAYALISNVLLLGFYHSSMRYLSARPAEEKGRVFHGMLAMIIVSCACFMLLAWLFPKEISEVLFADSSYQGTITAISVFVVSECLFEFVVLAFLRSERRITLCAVYQLLKSFARLAILWYGAINAPYLSDLLFNLALANGGLVVVAYIAHVVSSVPLAIGGLGRSYWKELLGFSAPIVVTTLLGWGNSFANRFLIAHQLGLADLAVFSVNYSIASIASFASLAITFAVVPHLNTAWNKGDKDATKRLLDTGISYYLLASLPLAVGVVVFYQPLVTLLAPSGYATNPLLMLSLSVFMVLYGLEQITTFATLLKNSHYSVLIRIASLAANLILCILLMSPLSIAGAGVAAVVALLITIFFGLYQIRTLVGFRFPWATLTRLIVPTLIMATVGTGLMSLFGGGIGLAFAAAILSFAGFVVAESFGKYSLIRAVVRQRRSM